MDVDLKSEIESYKIENDNLKRENDRLTIEYELKIESLKREVILKTTNYDALVNNYHEIEEKFKNGCDEKILLNQTYHDLSNEKFEIVKKFNTLESDFSTITELISRRENELLAAKNEIQELRTKLNEYKTNEIETSLKERDLEYRKKDIDKIEEISYKRNIRLCEDIKSLEENLSAANKKSFEERSKNSSLVFDLNSALESKRNEIKNQKKQIEKLKENVSYMEKVYEDKTESLRSALEGKNNVDSVLRKELNTQHQIIEVLKNERDELIEKQTTFIQTITELQDAFRENCEDSCKMRDECESKLEEYSSHIAELKKVLSDKENELGNANELIEKFRVKSLSEEELRLMNPATAAAIGALKRGYSLTQIYSEYLQVMSERNDLKVDLDRLNEYIQSILEELELKAPSFKKLQDERSVMESALSTIGQKYEKTLSDFFNCQSDVHDYQRKCEDLAKKLKREEQTCADLKQQNCCLLREIETARGTVIRSDGDNKYNNDSMLISRMTSLNQQSHLRRSYSSLISNNSSMDCSSRLLSSNDVITTHLVTFKNICELQQQNIQLLGQLRDLSSQMEEHDGLINEQSLQQVVKKLENALKDVAQLKEKAKEQNQLETIIDRQRHIIQALTSLSGNSDISEVISKRSLGLACSDNNIQTMVAVNETLITENVNRGEDQKLIVLEKQVNNLQLLVDKLKEEKELLKDSHNKITEELHQKLSDCKIMNENLMTKLSYSQEKTSTLEQNLVNRQLEMNDVQEELSKYKLKLITKTEEVKAVKNDIISTQSLVKNHEGTINDLRKNIKHIESLENQIREERSHKYELMKSTNNLAVQIANLQSVVISSSRTEDSSENQMNLKTQIRQLTLELKQEKSKYDTSQQMWQAKINESSVKIDSLSTQLSKVVCGKSAVVVSSIDDTRVTVDNHKSHEKTEKMDNLEEKIEDLSVANNSLQKQIESYQEILFNSEDKLLTNSNLMEQIQDEFQQKIDEEKKKNGDLEVTLENFQQKYNNLEEEHRNVKETFKTKIVELEILIDEDKRKRETLNNQVKDLKEKEIMLKKDIVRQRQLTKEAMENYQQELIFHSQESDSLQEVNEQLRKYQSQERDISQRLKEASFDRDRFKSDLENKDVVWNQERTLLQNEINELKVQRETLNNRVIDLNNVVVNLKIMLDHNLEGAIDEAVIHRESDLNEVVQYLRQQKENAESSKNQLEMDLYRLKTENSAQEEKINQLTNILENEKKFEEETSKPHAEVMRKLDTMQMLNESNSMLRKDRDRIKEELSDMMEKITTLQVMVEPVKSELKSAKKEIESLKLEIRSLVNERDLWRQRCDALVERSKKVNPEDFKKLCAEKDILQHTLLLEENKCRTLNASLEEMEKTVGTQNESLKTLEEELEELRKVNDDNNNVIQKRDVTISQLKDLGRKYKAEKESLALDISRMTEMKDSQSRDLDNLRQELNSSNAMLQESLQKLQQKMDCGNNEENVKRVNLLEKRLALMKSENEMLKNQNISLSQEQEEHADDIETSQPLVAPHSSAPTVARVAANVHPVIQKPSSCSNQISPSTTQSSGCQSTARQTAEIRPIPAIIVHASSTISDVPITTSLPVSVAQVLAASSVIAVSTVIFPSASTQPIISSTPLRVMKRLLNETIEHNQSHNEVSESKKIKLRVPELGESSLYADMIEEEYVPDMEEQSMTINEVETVGEEEYDSQEDIDDINLEDEETDLDERSEEDDSEEDESDDEPECIELSSDGRSNDDNEEEENVDEPLDESFEFKENEEEDVTEKNNESVSQQQYENEMIAAESKKKIEPIVWTDSSERSESVNEPSTSSQHTIKRSFNKISPSKSNLQMKPRNSMFAPHRSKAATPRRPFQFGGRNMSTRSNRVGNLFRGREFPQ